jgi:hypothetical protein
MKRCGHTRLPVTQGPGNRLWQRNCCGRAWSPSARMSWLSGRTALEWSGQAARPGRSLVACPSLGLESFPDRTVRRCVSWPRESRVLLRNRPGPREMLELFEQVFLLVIGDETQVARLAIVRHRMKAVPRPKAARRCSSVGGAWLAPAFRRSLKASIKSCIAWLGMPAPPSAWAACLIRRGWPLRRPGQDAGASADCPAQSPLQSCGGDELLWSDAGLSRSSASAGTARHLLCQRCPPLGRVEGVGEVQGLMGDEAT